MSDYIRGIRILIVEDEYVIAAELAGQFEGAGAQVLGPVPSIEDALCYVERAGVVQGAILDLHIRGGLVFPVADELGQRNIPYVFYTAYSREVIPFAIALRNACSSRQTGGALRGRSSNRPY